MHRSICWGSISLDICHLMLWEIQLLQEFLKYRRYQELIDLPDRDPPNWATTSQTLNF